MKPYGIKPGEWRSEDCGPPSKHRKIKSKNRRSSRRIMHKNARRNGIKDIQQRLEDV